MGKKVNNNTVTARVYPRALSLAARQGLELIDLEYVKEAGEFYLRVYIDRPQGVDHDCCALYSQALEIFLDKEDIISGSYYLEVSSPGVERALKEPQDFIRYKGREVKISLYAPLNHMREYSGELLGLDNEYVLLKNKSSGGGRVKKGAEGENVQEIRIPLKQIAKARLAAFF